MQDFLRLDFPKTPRVPAVVKDKRPFKANPMQSAAMGPGIRSFFGGAGADTASSSSSSSSSSTAAAPSSSSSSSSVAAVDEGATINASLGDTSSSSSSSSSSRSSSGSAPSNTLSASQDSAVCVLDESTRSDQRPGAGVGDGGMVDGELIDSTTSVTSPTKTTLEPIPNT